MPIGWQTGGPGLLAYSQIMPPERDLFANFERMRREMDELFGDVFDRTGLAPRKRGGFSPAVDVFYEGDPPRAVVQAELAGIDPDELTLEIDGRELVLAGHRRPADAEGRVYQQLEIDLVPFRRRIQLGPDVLDAAAAVAAPGAVPHTPPVLPLRETIPLPDTLIPLAVGQDRSVALVDDVLRGDRMLVMVASRHPDKEVPGPDDLFEVGVVGAIAR